MAKYRKKPVVIEAVTWNGKYSEPTEWPDWFRAAVDAGTLYRDLAGNLKIKTLEGDLTVSLEDKIIQGVKGELYPCKPDIFDATYEPA